MEDEFLEMLKISFNELLNDSSSYLSTWFLGSHAREEPIENLEKKIARLREKLGLPFEDSPANIPYEFASRFNDLMPYFTYKKQTAKLFLEKLNNGARVIKKEDIDILISGHNGDVWFRNQMPKDKV